MCHNVAVDFLIISSYYIFNNFSQEGLFINKYGAKTGVLEFC